MISLLDYKGYVGLAIKKLRHESGLTQKQLAENIGATSKGSIKEAENGRALTINKVELLASEFEVTPSYIYYLAEQMRDNEYIKTKSKTASIKRKE